MFSRFSTWIVAPLLVISVTVCMGQLSKPSGDATPENLRYPAASPYGAGEYKVPVATTPEKARQGAPPSLSPEPSEAAPGKPNEPSDTRALRDAIRHMIEQQEHGRARLGEILRQHQYWTEYYQQMLRRAEELLKGLMDRKEKQPEQAVDRPASVADRKGEDGFRALYTMNRDGTNVRYLVAAPGMISSSSPEWSHDGAMIAFDAVPEVGALSDAHLFVYALRGPFKGTFRDFGCGNVPSWSPDDRQIAYMVNGGNPCEVEHGIWIMDSDGSNRRRICQGWYPRWSPDGKRLHVYAYFDRPASIHIVEVPNGRARKILGEPMEVKFGGGTWSPDGKRLVFVGVRDGKEHLATVDAEGRAPSIHVLYTEKGNDRELIGPPAWSPDGKQIVFAIQEKDSGATHRRWGRTYLYSIAAEVPSAPALLQPERNGLINRSPMWSRDSSTVIFSSER